MPIYKRGNMEKMLEVPHEKSHCARQQSSSEDYCLKAATVLKYASEISEEQSGFVKGRVS